MARQGKTGTIKTKEMDALLAKFCERKYPHLVELLRTELGTTTDIRASKLVLTPTPRPPI
jgi:hypothetical protein